MSADAPSDEAALLVDLLLTVAYIDGRFHQKEEAFVQRYIDSVIAMVEQAGTDLADRARRRGESRARFDALHPKLRAEVAALNDEVRASGANTFVPCRLKVRALSLFGRLPAPRQPVALELVQSLIRADGMVSPSEQDLFQELGAYFKGASPPAPAPAPAPAAATWGVAVSVNRDGTDGERFSLGGEYVIVGRAGADIVFDQDRFLARHHARLEPTADGCRVVPIDTQNGVFRKMDAPLELVNGSMLLVGREVLRFEKVDADEQTPDSLVRHGVALFGSPPREPWGRLLQMLPSGGVRDVRHLWDDEITIGREEGDLVYSDDAFLSRRHCTIGWDGSRAVITDLGSSNGTFMRLVGVTAVKHGEHIRMGDQLFRIELRR